MSEQTPAPTTPAAPDTRSTGQKFDDFFAKKAPEAAPAATPVPDASAPAKKTIKLKLIDDKEEDVDLDAEYADEARRTKLTLDLQKGRNYERAVSKTAAEKYAEGQRALAARLAKDGYTFRAKIPNPQTLDDYEFIPPPPPTTADAELDPLTKEEEELASMLSEGDVAAVLRAGEIRAEKKLILREREQAKAMKAAADKTAAERRATETQAAQKATYDNAVADLYGKIDEFLTARTKSYEGPDADRRTKAARAQAFAEAEAAAKGGKGWDDVIAQAKATVFADADALDQRAAFYRGNLPEPKVPPAKAPIVGGAPAGGAPQDPYAGKSSEDKFDTFFASKGVKGLSRR